MKSLTPPITDRSYRFPAAPEPIKAREVTIQGARGFIRRDTTKQIGTERAEMLINKMVIPENQPLKAPRFSEASSPNPGKTSRIEV